MSNVVKDSDISVLKDLREYLHTDYGIYFSDEKLYSLRNKLERRIRRLPSVKNLEEYESYLENNTDEIPYLLDEISTNKTAFFREKKHWDFLTQRIVPEWQNRHKKIKAWSAACSTGEEPYSLAMWMDHHLDGHFDGNQPESGGSAQVLASDISRQALQDAKNGIYDSKRIEQVREYHPKFPKRYFRPRNDQFVVQDSLKDVLTLRKFNLSHKRYPFKDVFDLIMCRNVLIYFDSEMIEHVIEQMTNCLTRKGYLFLGHTESIQDIDHRLTKVQPAVYRKG